MSVSESGGDWRRARCSLYPTALNAMPRTPYRHRQTPQNEHHSSRNRSRPRHVPHNPRPSFWSPTTNLTSLPHKPRSTRQTSALRRRYIHTHFRYQYFKHCMHANNACSSFKCLFLISAFWNSCHGCVLTQQGGRASLKRLAGGRCLL